VKRRSWEASFSSGVPQGLKPGRPENNNNPQLDAKHFMLSGESTEAERPSSLSRRSCDYSAWKVVNSAMK
jgi:hypothetical protein